MVLGSGPINDVYDGASVGAVYIGSWLTLDGARAHQDVNRALMCRLSRLSRVVAENRLHLSTGQTFKWKHSPIVVKAFEDDAGLLERACGHLNDAMYADAVEEHQMFVSIPAGKDKVSRF